MSEPLVVIAAFFQRVIQRELGHERAGFGKEITSRSAKYIAELKHPQKSMGFKIALHNLAHEYDLIGAEEALNETALELQLTVIRLANCNKSAKSITSEMLNEEPVAKLSSAILAQALKDGASAVRIELSSVENSDAKVHYKVAAGWEEVMTLPSNLSRPLHGSFTRIEGATFENLRPHIVLPGELPESVSFDKNTDSLIELSI